MVAVKLPDIMSGSITFENVLSIRVLEWLFTLVGYKIKGINKGLSLILPGRPNHGILLFGRYSLMLFNYSLFVSSTKGILSSGLILHTYVTILASFLSGLITSSFFS